VTRPGIIVTVAFVATPQLDTLTIHRAGPLAALGFVAALVDALFVNERGPLTTRPLAVVWPLLFVVVTGAGAPPSAGFCIVSGRHAALMTRPSIIVTGAFVATPALDTFTTRRAGPLAALGFVAALVDTFLQYDAGSLAAAAHTLVAFAPSAVLAVGIRTGATLTTDSFVTTGFDTLGDARANCLAPLRFAPIALVVAAGLFVIAFHVALDRVVGRRNPRSILGE